MRAALTFCLALVAGQGFAQGKAPAPQFAVEASFHEIIARLLAQDCPGLSFDHAGFDRHMRALMGEYSDRGHHTRRVGDLFAPIQPERYEPLFEELMDKYELTPDSPDTAFCAAGVAEAEWRTPIGRMLRVSEKK